MSERNGHTLAPTYEQLHEEYRRVRAQSRLSRAKAEAQLWESLAGQGYGYGLSDWLDPYQFRQDAFGNMWLPLGAGLPQARKDGRNQPFVWTDADLDSARTLARWLAVKNDLVAGALKTLRNYTVKKGYEWEARPAKEYERSPQAQALAKLVQKVIDDHSDLNNLPGRERSSCWRAVRDGEAFTRHFAQADGSTVVRFVEPEQVRERESDADCAFGVRTMEGDIETPLAYSVTYDGGAHYDWVDASEVCHLKRNVDENIKRGLSDLYASGDAFDGVSKLLRNMREAGAVQAAIAWIEQFETGTAAQVQSHLAGLKDLNRPQVEHPLSGRRTDYQRFEPGTIARVGKGKTYIPAPLAANTTQHTQIVQACLRALGCRWNMPEYMISGDASNANYSSTLVSGSPFVNAVECEQDDFGRFFLRWRWIAIRNACEAGLIPLPFEEVSKVIDLHYTAPQVAVANEGEKAQIDHLDLAAGVMSLQTRRARRGLDDEQERKNLGEEPPTRISGKATDLDPQGNPMQPADPTPPEVSP